MIIKIFEYDDIYSNINNKKLFYNNTFYNNGNSDKYKIII